MTDKRYRECMAEIAAVLDRYDMAGAVTVVDKERAMFKYVFPTWSCITINGAGVRLRSKRADYPTREAQHQAMELSAHILMQMRDIAAQTFGMCEEIAGAMAKEGITIEHKPYANFDPEFEH